MFRCGPIFNNLHKRRIFLQGFITIFRLSTMHYRSQSQAWYVIHWSHKHFLREAQTARVLSWFSPSGAWVWRLEGIRALASASPWFDRQSDFHHCQTLVAAEMLGRTVLACWWNEGPRIPQPDGDGTVISLLQSHLLHWQSQQVCLPNSSFL